MIPIKIPAWVDSIRSVITFIFVVAFCIGVFTPEQYLSPAEMQKLGDITKDIVIFYFVFKRRTESENGGEK
jgi:hypothetical protein